MEGEFDRSHCSFPLFPLVCFMHIHIHTLQPLRPITAHAEVPFGFETQQEKTPCEERDCLSACTPHLYSVSELSSKICKCTTKVTFCNPAKSEKSFLPAMVEVMFHQHCFVCRSVCLPVSNIIPKFVDSIAFTSRPNLIIEKCYSLNFHVTCTTAHKATEAIFREHCTSTVAVFF